MAISNPAHVSRLEILFALFAHCQSRIGKLDIERLLKPRRSKCQYILFTNKFNKQVELDSLQVPHVRTGYLRHEKSLGDTSFAA